MGNSGPCCCGTCTAGTTYSSSSGNTRVCWETPIEATSLPGGGSGGSSGSGFGDSSGIPSTEDNSEPIYIYEGEEECFGDGSCTPPLYWAQAEASSEPISAATPDLGNNYTESSFPGKDKGLPFEWWLDTDFIINSGNFDMPSDIEGAPDEKPNAKEVALFAIFQSQAILHIENSVTALNKAHELATSGTFPLSGLEDGKADAFRHAFWNALGTAEFGSHIMKLFADAHEWGQTNTQAVTMDFHNNDKGRQIGGNFNIFSSDSNISNAVLSALTNGDLVYINGSGVTVPTNF